MPDEELIYEEMDINSADIIVPRYSYQRPLHPTRAKKIATHFDEHLANIRYFKNADGAEGYPDPEMPCRLPSGRTEKIHIEICYS